VGARRFRAIRNVAGFVTGGAVSRFGAIAQAGFVVVAAEYRVVPDVFPPPLEDGTLRSLSNGPSARRNLGLLRPPRGGNTGRS
jgi:hypothetical protein